MVAREVLESYLPEPRAWPNGEIFTYSIEDNSQYGTVLMLTVQNPQIKKVPKGDNFYALLEIDMLLDRDLQFPESTLQQLMAQLEQTYDIEVNGERYKKERSDRLKKYKGRNKPPETGVDIDEQA